jgi:hypothetical protein
MCVHIIAILYVHFVTHIIVIVIVLSHLHAHIHTQIVLYDLLRPIDQTI